MKTHTTKPGGITQVLSIAFPLIIASSGHAARLFADRVMLARYSQTAIAAAMPAGLASFCLMCFFFGIAGYSATFVAQYSGSGHAQKTGLAVWQGIYVALIGGLLVGLCAPAARFIFTWMNHGPEVIEEQIIYFQSLVQLASGAMLLAAINGFWSGRGRTSVVMGIELLCTTANIFLNQVLIFGKWGFPELGILGAGLATGLSNFLGLAVALTLFLSPTARQRFGTLPRRTFNPALFMRLMRFGSPAGFQFALDLIAFNLFVVLLGRLGAMELEAANIAFAVNALSFQPLIGLGMSVSIIVGQNIGAGLITPARRAVRSAFTLALIYGVILGVIFIATPDVILKIFARSNDPNQTQTLALAAVYLRFVTAYLLFDSTYIIFSHAIRGAGDTRFAMFAGIILSWATLALPGFIAYHSGAGANTLWTILVAHVMLAGIVFLARYRAGHWTRMRVIEEAPLEIPSFEIEIQTARRL